MQSGALTLCRQFTGMEEITGLYILPHVDKGAPAKVSDLKASFSNGSTTGKVSFTMPSATKGGETLSGNINYKVYLGDQKKEGTAAAGKTVQLDATLPEGRCKIVVTTSNAKGESERAATSLWIGKDAPATVSGLSLKRTLDKGLQLPMGRRLNGCAQRICRPGKRNVQVSETARHQDYEREHHRYRALRQWRV